MKKVIAFLCSMLILLPIVPVYAEAEAVQIYVSPEGSNNGNGSESRPFATIERAQQAVRDLAENMQSDIIVNLGAGTYFLENPILMDETDSGRNGYTVKWQGVPGETIVSGGTEISGWQQHDGDIWKIKLPDEYINRWISNVYVGDRVGAMSRIEDTPYLVGNLVHAEEEEGGPIKKAAFAPEVLPYDPEMKDTIIYWDWAWRHYMLPTNGVTQDEDGNTELNMIQGTPNFVFNSNYVPHTYAFMVVNAYAFIDNPDEFYYDKEDGILYYQKHEEDDLTAAQTIIPRLEYLWRIEGETDLNPAENISFSGITFSHSMCMRNYQYGLYANQALNLMDDKFGREIEGVPYDLTNRGAVEVLNAKNITFENNEFRKLDNVGLAMYGGVSESRVQGNLFCDISDTGLMVGSPSGDVNGYEEKYNMAEISDGKTRTISEPYSIWYGSVNCTGGGNNSFTLDLEDSYTISKVKFQLGGPISGSDVLEIRASNLENFAGYEILARLKKKSEWEVEPNKYEVDIGDPKKYRYIQLINKNGNISYGTEVRVYTTDFGDGKKNSLCSNLDITDNYLVRTVREFWGSAAVQVFHATYINLSHNEIEGSPYSAITFGWDWGRTWVLPGSKINYNKISGHMARMHDGAGIYALGDHPDSEMRGNHIIGGLNSQGGIYPDEGSANWVMEENILEEVNMSFHPWAASSQDMKMINNYTTQPYYVIGAGATTMENTELFIRKNMPEHIKEKAALAGIREEYEHIKDRAGEGKTAYEPVLIDGYPSEQNYPYHYYWNDPYKYMAMGVYEANNMLKTVKISNLIKGYEEEVAAFEDAIIEANTVANSEFDRDTYYTAYRILKQKMDEFATCGIFTDKEYAQIYQNFNVEVEESDAGNAVINSDKPIYMDFMIDDFEYLTVGGGNAFRNKEKTQFKLTDGDANVTYFAANKFGDAVFEGKMSFEKGNGIDWQGIILRATSANKQPGAGGENCYIIDFQDYSIEVQRFNNGNRTVFYGNIGGSETIFETTLGYGGWDRGSLSDIRVGTINEENGVRIFLEANGKEIFNIVDESPEALYEGGYFGVVTPDGTLTIEKKSTETNEFFDIYDYLWAKTPIYQLAYAGVINGVEKNTFNPNGNVTRAEYAKMLAKILKLSGTSSSFADVSAGSWYFDSVAGLEKIGAFEGVFSGNFNPGTPILREEMAAIALKALKATGNPGAEVTANFTDVSEITENIRQAVLEYASMGLISGMGDGTFAPKGTATRAQAATLLYRVYSLQEEN